MNMNEFHALAQKNSDQALNRIKLTPLQQAYKIGVSGACKFSCPAYFYQEYIVGTLDINRLRSAVELIVEKNDALRLHPTENFDQVLVELSARDCFRSIDLSDINPDRFSEIYQSLSENFKNSTQKNHNFCVQVIYGNQQYYVGMLYQLSACDAPSVSLIQWYLRNLYSNPQFRMETASYEKYVAEIYLRRQGRDFIKAKAFWKKRIANLPPAPQLPIIANYGGNQVSRFQRLTHYISEEKYQSLCALSSAHGFSINSLLLTIYGDVLRCWSHHKNFTINLMLGQRELSENFRYEAVGNCSSTILMELASNDGALIERVRANYIQGLVCLGTLSYTGIDVIRDYAEHHGLAMTNPIMPIVFASSIGVDPRRNGFVVPISSWENTISELSTPQVLLDHQVFDDKQGLKYTWDFVEAAFPAGLMGTMFGLYNTLLDYVASSTELIGRKVDSEYISFLSNSIEPVQTPTKENVRLLQSEIYKSFINYPDRVAVQSPHKSLTYADVERLVCATGNYLIHSGVERGDIVAIHIDKGWTQLVAVIAVVSLGAVYLPLDKGNPVSRIRKILAKSNCRYLLSDESITFPETTVFSIQQAMVATYGEALLYPDIGADDAAYVIFTSGSTGEPKGVVISHGAASNTIDDVNKKCAVTENAKAIALSALHFDLSVYDIFGILGVGGTLVYPPVTVHPDPFVWWHTVKKYGVTLWNSVPAYMEMLVHLPDIHDLTTLKTVMLSGDWVKKDLVQKIQNSIAGVDVIAMGGATEAAIWSNYFFASRNDFRGPHVPYGYPLENQCLYILDEDANLCPSWKEGDIYIAGEGLGIGYLNDSDKTNSAFIRHPKTGVRLYKTGDRGCYAPGEGIHFLGRKDFQIKIRGHRIELGEIDSVAMSHPSVISAVAFVCNGAQENAFILLGVIATENADLGSLQQYLSAHLPDYMCPRKIVKIETVPITNNGKLDRNILASTYSNLYASSTAPALPTCPEEIAIYDIWKTILGLDRFSIDDSFFELGGSSIAAVEAAIAVEKISNKKYSAEIVFQYQTIRTLAAAIADNYEEKIVKRIQAGSKGAILLLPPVGGNLLCYEKCISYLSGFAVYGVSLPYNRLLNIPDSESIEPILHLFSNALAAEKDIQNLVLCGWSMGGTLAYALAPLLENLGIKILGVHMIDSYMGTAAAEPPHEDTLIELFFSEALGNVSSQKYESPLDKKQLLHSSTELNLPYQLFRKNYLLLLNSNSLNKMFKGNRCFYKANHGGFPGLISLSESLGCPVSETNFYRSENHFSILDVVFRDLAKSIDRLVAAEGQRQVELAL